MSKSVCCLSLLYISKKKRFYFDSSDQEKENKVNKTYSSSYSGEVEHGCIPEF